MKHLSAEQLNELRSQLETMRGQLRADIREELLRDDQEQYGELAGQVHDLGDESVADLLVDVNVAAVGRLISELRAVEDALARIHMGGYGLCQDCGEAIPLERLEAYPTALRCLVHQESHEKLYAEEGKPSL